jgi:hypothetical protein
MMEGFNLAIFIALVVLLLWLGVILCISLLLSATLAIWLAGATFFKRLPQWLREGRNRYEPVRQILESRARVKELRARCKGLFGLRLLFTRAR